MIKSILLSVIPGDFGGVGEKFALALAKSSGARLEAVCVVDPDVVSPPEPVPIGGDAYRQHKVETLITKAQQSAEETLKGFKAACASAGVAGKGVLRTGETIGLLSAHAGLHDIIVLEFKAGSSEEREHEIEIANGLLYSNPRPLIIANLVVPGGGTLIAYDGSIPAMRSLQLFSSMGLRQDAETFVLSVGQNAEDCMRNADVGASFLNERGYRAQPVTVVSSETPAKIILDEARKRNASMIVAGAYGHRGWKEWLLGSTTEHLLAHLKGVLFIHH